MRRPIRSGRAASRRRSPAPAGGRRPARGRSAGRAPLGRGAARARRPGRASSSAMASAGLRRWRRRSRCRRPCPARGGAIRPARAQATPGTSRSRSSIGSAIAVARPSGMRGIVRAQRRQRRARPRPRPAASRPGIARICSLARPRRARSAADVDAERSWIAPSCSMRDGARFEEPPQVGRQVGDRRLDEHPAAGLVHLAEPLEHLGIDVGRRIGEQRTEVGVRVDLARADERGGACEHRLFDADRRGSSPATRAGRAFDEAAWPKSRGSRQESAG